MTRAGQLWLGLSLCLAGCGFHPLYAPGGQQDAALGAIYVDIIPDRAGQLLRQSLQQRLAGADEGRQKRYLLDVAYSEALEGISIQPDNSGTRTRAVGRVIWTLRMAGAGGKQIASGQARSLDGYNTINEQFFYADLSQEATQHRLAETLADQIAQSIAVFFRKHPDLA